ncbi:hypothetical protein U9M48_002548 [Paspalum notatum var. saurae]|uniref:Uncharacterized protein n=1 Tax=Paspalum notatum var. saurae TaxID=547442 RepID=A0AAQ3PR51_PASNO
MSPGADSGSSQRPAASAPRPVGARPPVRHRRGRAGARSHFLRYKPNPRIETKTKRILGERNNDAPQERVQAYQVATAASQQGTSYVQSPLLLFSRSATEPWERWYTHSEVYMLSGLSTCSETNAICNEMIYDIAIRFYA